MRIDLYGPTTTESPQQVNTTRADKTVSDVGQPTTHTPPDDTTSLSSGTDSVQSLTTAAFASATSREPKIASLKQAISMGQYSVDPAQIAEALSKADI